MGKQRNTIVILILAAALVTLVVLGALFLSPNPASRHASSLQSEPQVVVQTDPVGAYDNAVNIAAPGDLSVRFTSEALLGDRIFGG